MIVPPSLDKPFDIIFSQNTSRDIRNINENEEWDFKVLNDYTSKTTIKWSNDIKFEEEIVLLDLENKEIVDMKVLNKYTFLGKHNRNFKILKGSNKYIAEKSSGLIDGFKLYPNPTKRYLYIESFNKINLDDISIYTSNGKKLTIKSKQIIKDDELSRIIKFDFNDIKEGQFILKIGSKEKLFIIY